MDGLIALFIDMPFMAWLTLAGVLLLVELLTGTTFVLWPAIAAAILGLITIFLLDGQWALQWTLFAALTVGLGVFGRPYAERWVNNSPTDKPMLNRVTQKKVGMRGVVATDFTAGRGRVRLGDTEWAGRAENETSPLTAGTSIEVVAMDGITLIVAPIKKNS